MTTNAFIAVDLADAERHALAAALAEASPGPRLPGRRTPPANWHITLRFLGPVDDDLLDRIDHGLTELTLAGSGAVRCVGLGAFPKPSRATVVFGAIDDGEELLERLAAVCEDLCRDLGLEPEERPFVPHLTLARVRPAVDVRRLFDSFGEFAIRIRVREVVLLRTISGRDGVRYERRSAIPLT